MIFEQKSTRNLKCEWKSRCWFWVRFSYSLGMKSIDQQRMLLKEIDDLLWDVQKHTSLILKLQATNWAEQLDIFLQKQWNYAPQFRYNFPDPDLLSQILTQLKDIKHSHIDTQSYSLPCAKLFADKIQEKIREAELILAYIKQDFANIKRLNTLLYGAFDKELLDEAEHVLLSYQEPPAQTRWKKLSTPEIIATLEKYMSEHQITDIKIKPMAFFPMKFMLMYQKSWCLLAFPEHLVTREHTLMANIIHEIEVHHQRYVNAKKTWRNLLSYGTASYQKDEEWFAMYQAYRYLCSISPDFHKTSMYEKYHIMWHAQGKSYQDMCDELKHFSPKMSLVSLFKKITRLYMGIQDTAATGAPLFLYNKMYLDGFSKIQKRHQEWNDLQTLFIGKIKIEDIDLVGHIPDTWRLS